MNNERFQYLFERYCTGTCSPEERQELAMLCLMPENRQTLETIMEATWEQTSLKNDMPLPEGDLILQRILHPSVSELPPVRKMGWQRWVAAASIVLVAGLGSYFFLTHKKDISREIPQAIRAGDIKPPTINKAVITLADGTVLSLDSSGNGQLAVQDNVKLVKLANGQIIYKTIDDRQTSALQYNTLSNPRATCASQP